MTILTIFGIWLILGFVVGTFLGNIIRFGSDSIDENNKNHYN